MKRKLFPGSLFFIFAILVFAISCQSPDNKFQKTVTILTSVDTAKVRIIGLPCPNSFTKAGGWTYQEAERKKDEIYSMQLSVKYKDWKNPTTGGAVHINKNDEIEVYQFWFGIYQGRNDTAVSYSPIAKDTAVALKNDDTLWNYVQGIGEGNETSVLITSEYNLRKSESFKKVMSELWKPGIQIYYLTTKQ
jgi:hypothetical protein